MGPPWFICIKKEGEVGMSEEMVQYIKERFEEI
jgi:hypothetical protein